MSELGIWDGLIGHGQTIGERSSQQDYYIVRPVFNDDGDQTLLMVLADGMGGHVGGDIASQISSQAFVDEFEDVFGNLDLADCLKSSMIAADNSIRIAIAENEALAGMGTTLVGAFWDGESISWISIGDSPMWIARHVDNINYRLDRANDDHSLKPLIEKRLKEGVITQTQADNMGSHQLRSAVVGEGIDVEDTDKVNVFATNPIKLYKDEYIIIASDGIETISEDKIASILANTHHAQDIVDNLLREVQISNKKHQDNTTIVVFKVPTFLKAKPKQIHVPKSASRMTVRIEPKSI